MATKYLDLTGLGHFWEKSKEYIDTADLKKVDKTTTVNGKPLSSAVTLSGPDINVGGSGTYKSNTVQAAIDALDAAVKSAVTSGVTSFGGKTGAITLEGSAGNGSVNFSMAENKLQGAVVGLKSAAYTESSAYAPASHNHTMADVTGLTDLVNGKASKSEALKTVTGNASASASNVTITLTNTTANGSAANPTITLPVASESTQGTITEAKIKALAKAEAASVAGSAYRVKGTKKTLDEVLAVPSAVVGDTYNIEAEFSLNSKKYPAGTNVVFVGGGESPANPKEPSQWDALGGTVDLSAYATNSSVDGKLANKVDKTTTVNGKPLTSSVVLGGADITLTGYAKGSTSTPISASDKVNTAIGKIEVALDGKAASTHTHTTAQITDLQGKLDAKLNKTDLVAISSAEIDAIFAPK